MEDKKLLQNNTLKMVCAVLVIFVAMFLGFGVYKIFSAQKPKKEDNLSFVAIVKNEGPYLKEWIEYHKMVGVDRFYIYDNESTDNTKEVLSDYIKSGEVVYKYYPGAAQQVPAYTEALNNYKSNTKYMGFIDLDEFVVPVEQDNLYNAVDEIISKNEKAAGVAINWRMYGSSGFEDKPEGHVMENYKRRAPDAFGPNQFIKTICNPKLVSKIEDAHFVDYNDGYYCVSEGGGQVSGSVNPNGSCNKLRINHYFTKSKNEYIKKRERGMADHAEEKRTMEGFYGHDRNDVYDYIMERFVPSLKTKV